MPTSIYIIQSTGKGRKEGTKERGKQEKQKNMDERKERGRRKEGKRKKEGRKGSSGKEEGELKGKIK